MKKFKNENGFWGLNTAEAVDNVIKRKTLKKPSNCLNTAEAVDNVILNN